MGLANAPVSLEAPIGDDGSGRIADLVPDDTSEGPFEQRHRLAAARGPRPRPRACSPTASARVIELRYGLIGRDPLTLEQIGSAMGITRERVRQIESNSPAQAQAASSGAGVAGVVRGSAAW